MTESVNRDTVLKIDTLTISYDGKVVVKDLSADIVDVAGRGQVISLLGPSGIGKTTLIKALAGLIPATHGTVEVYHEGEKKLIPVERGMIGVVAQKYPLLRHRTVFGNLMVAARKRKHSSEEDEARCMKYLERFGIGDLKNRYPVQLSGGQRQRVAIIQQLIRSEHFILLDEPFTGLDPIMKQEACELIREVADMNELNTIIVVTHGIQEALCVSDTIWMIGRDKDDAGKVIPGASIKKVIDLSGNTGKNLSCANHCDSAKAIEKEFVSL